MPRDTARRNHCASYVALRRSVLDRSLSIPLRMGYIIASLRFSAPSHGLEIVALHYGEFQSCFEAFLSCAPFSFADDKRPCDTRKSHDERERRVFTGKHLRFLRSQRVRRRNRQCLAENLRTSRC